MRHPANRRPLPPAPGFTLIEMMVVLVIVSILAAVAYPAYTDAVRKAKRTEGRAALMQLMQQEERYYSQHNSYIGFSAASTDPDEKQFKWYSGDSPASSAYQIEAAACGSGDTLQDCVRLAAQPGTSRVDAGFQDAECGKLTLQSNGVKGADGDNCWR